MNREKSPNSGIFASPGSFLWENISLLIDVCSCNGLESLRSILLRVLLMYSQYTWKVHTNYIQLKGFQNVSLKALPFSSKFPDELPGGWFFQQSETASSRKWTSHKSGRHERVWGDGPGCTDAVRGPQAASASPLAMRCRREAPLSPTLGFPDRPSLCFYRLCWAVLIAEALGLLIWNFYWSQ